MNYELGLLRNPDYKLDQAKCRTFFGSFLHPSVPGGYPAAYADSIKYYADLDSLPRDAKLGVLDDLFLEETAQLLAEGFTNITLLAKEDIKTNKIPNICYMTMQMRLASVVYNKEEVTIRILKEDEGMKEHFDLCIMNPPFSVAPDVIKSSLEISDRVICLAPLSKFKKNKMYQRVERYEVIDSEVFEDAAITDNLIIAALRKTHHNPISWDEFQIESTNPKFKLFYKNNNKHKQPYTILPNMGATYNIVTNEYAFNTSCDFMITTRTSQDGVHKDINSHDIRWNIKKELTSTLAYMIRFSSETCKNNFCKYWYRADLSQKLIKALNKKSGQVYAAIPNIDWSRTDVEYTDEYVLEQMGLKWNENKNGVERL